MRFDWNCLTNELQLLLAEEALKRASDTIADQAESLAGEIENGFLRDRGGPDALRLLAAVIRVIGRPGELQVAGHA